MYVSSNFTRKLLKLKTLHLKLCFSTLQKTSPSLGCYDVVVIGGGIVGMATARRLKIQEPNLSCAVLEKEKGIAIHQSGNNSGVIHAGIYYKPGSLRAKLCSEGLKLMYAYCAEKDIPYKKCGKLIIATDGCEEERLVELYKRGLENNVPDLELIDGDRIRDYEPAAIGVKAISSPHTGIVDYGQVAKSFGLDFKNKGGDIHTCFEACSFDISPESTHDTPDINKYPVKILDKSGKSVSASFVLTCAGLHSGKVAALSGGSKVPAIIPFRGEYFTLSDEKKKLINGNIYPVPDPRFPFLGIHVTPTIHGEVLIGPNAVLAMKREGYKQTDISITDMVEYIRYRGFRKLAIKHFTYGVTEWLNSIMKSRQVKHVQKLVPCITAKDLIRGPAGVRAQAVTEEGNLVDDFVFDSGTGAARKFILHCRNAPSPAATSSMAIANVLVDKVLSQMNSPKETEIKSNVI